MEAIEYQLDIGVIERAQTEWASAVLLAPNKRIATKDPNATNLDTVRPLLQGK